MTTQVPVFTYVNVEPLSVHTPAPLEASSAKATGKPDDAVATNVCDSPTCPDAAGVNVIDCD